MPHNRSTDPIPQYEEILLVMGWQFDGALLNGAGGEDHDDEDPIGRQTHQFQVTYGGRTGHRILHDGHLTSDLGQQPHGSGDDVVQVDRTVHEGGDGPLLGCGERLDRCNAIDEHAISLVGGDPPGAGVGMGDVSLVLQDSHVIAHGGR
jgi:hypothetical protein